mmetsp:Transcript_35464/g.56724  ORF Transcript_35464/g.56724 Transcript_35464/m.56724 type:complete len:444 (+) Transcript_35464:327-1658(+)
MGGEDGTIELPKTTSNGGVLLLAENVLEKLKLVEYDVEYCQRKNINPFPKTYFASPAANASSQWSSFIGLVSWLMKEIGHEFEVDKYDDPNTSSNKMMLALKKLNFESDFPVSRLKQGYGEAVCSVLDFLVSKILSKRGFRFQDPIYPEADGFEEAEVDDADLGSADIVDEAIESEEEDVLYSENVRGGRNEDKAEQKDRDEYDREGSFKDNGIIENEQSPEFQAAWRAELERVAPRLKRGQVQTVSGNEWRSHLEQTKKHETTIQEALPNCTQKLAQINEDLSLSLERISGKEKFLANSFEHLSKEYKEVQVQLEEVQTKYDTSNEAVEKLSNQLSTVSEALEELKGDMDSRGNSMVDTSPLQKIRKALAKLKAEIKQMELRIGVVGHSLLQASLENGHDGRNSHGKLRDSGVASASSPKVKSPSVGEFDRSPRSPTNFHMF